MNQVEKINRSDMLESLHTLVGRIYTILSLASFSNYLQGLTLKRIPKVAGVSTGKPARDKSCRCCLVRLSTSLPIEHAIPIDVNHLTIPSPIDDFSILLPGKTMILMILLCNSADSLPYVSQTQRDGLMIAISVIVIWINNKFYCYDRHKSIRIYDSFLLTMDIYDDNLDW